MKNLKFIPKILLFGVPTIVIIIAIYMFYSKDKYPQIPDIPFEYKEIQINVNYRKSDSVPSSMNLQIIVPEDYDYIDEGIGVTTLSKKIFHQNVEEYYKKAWFPYELSLVYQSDHDPHIFDIDFINPELMIEVVNGSSENWVKNIENMLAKHSGVNLYYDIQYYKGSDNNTLVITEVSYEVFGNKYHRLVGYRDDMPDFLLLGGYTDAIADPSSEFLLWSLDSIKISQ